ncbi:hypothetical protein, partial [uncultured Methanofollis sp.]|uniref:hypothetical protein n=1 Tax=uncultured Methanofollis sp. TaxID=262500 RepID=UPI002616D8AD
NKRSEFEKTVRSSLVVPRWRVWGRQRVRAARPGVLSSTLYPVSGAVGVSELEKNVVFRGVVTQKRHRSTAFS